MQKSMGYDHPAYQTRVGHVFPALAAGASGNTSKFIAFTSMIVFGLVLGAVATGSSTTTSWNGTLSQVSVGNDSVSLLRVMNNAAAGAAPSLSTATYGPFSVNNSPTGVSGTSTATTTNSSAPGYTNYVSLFGTGTTGTLQAGSNTANGGVVVNPGDILYCVRGTDATAVTAIALDLGLVPLASVGA